MKLNEVFTMPHRKGLLFSLRNLEYFLLWITLWQGSFLAKSPIQLSSWIPIPNGVSSTEIILVFMFLVLAMERTMSGDYALHRSYFNPPLLFLAAAVFVSWANGCIVNQRFAIVLEIHDIPEWPIIFLFVSNTFRDPEEGPLLFKMLFLTMIPKIFESYWSYAFGSSVRNSWGLVQSWRDGYLLDVAIIGALVMMHYRGTKLKRLKWYLYLAFPAAEAILILGFRRAAILASVGAAMFMFFTLPRGRRKKQLVVVGSVLGGFILFSLITNPLAVAARFMGVLQPAGEGSAYIRLMELPNVLLNIWHHPILGVPFGVPWTTYYRMPISAVYTTLGTHTSYLYYPLRMGIFGVILFGWLFGSMIKAAILNYRFRKTEEDFFYGQLSLQMLATYFISASFGLMYADGLGYVLVIMMVAFQHQAYNILGTSDLRRIAFWRSIRAGSLVYQTPLGDRIRQILSARFRKPEYSALNEVA